MLLKQPQVRCQKYQYICRVWSKSIRFPKILRGNENVTARRTGGRTDNLKTVDPPYSVCWGNNNDDAFFNLELIFMQKYLSTGVMFST